MTLWRAMTRAGTPARPGLWRWAASTWTLQPGARRAADAHGRAVDAGDASRQRRQSGESLWLAHTSVAARPPPPHPGYLILTDGLHYQGARAPLAG